MDQAFILPLPKSPYKESSTPSDSRQFWKRALNQLFLGQISWEQFLSPLKDQLGILPSHPAATVVLDQNGYSLLHLAVLQDRNDLVEILKDHQRLKFRPDHFGMTPLDLAHFLNKKCAGMLDSKLGEDFFSQPNVDTETLAAGKHLTFLPHPVYENEEIFNELLAKAKKAKEEEVVPAEKIWLGIYFDKEIQQGAHPKVSIRKINDRIGCGVFAKQKISSCAFVGEYTGLVKERKRKELKDKVYCVRLPIWGMGKRHFVVDAEKGGNFTRFINHSDNPNIALISVYWRGLIRMIFMTTKVIEEGSQLTFDYGPTFWKDLKQKPLDL